MATAKVNLTFERPGQYYAKCWLYEDAAFITDANTITPANATSATLTLNLVYGKSYKIYCAAVRQDDYGDQSALLSNITAIPVYAAGHKGEESPVYFPYEKAGTNIFTDTEPGGSRSVSTGIEKAPVARLTFTGYFPTATDLPAKFTPEEVTPASASDIIEINADMANVKKHAVITNGAFVYTYPLTNNFKGSILGSATPFNAQFLDENNAAVTPAFAGNMFFFFKEPFFAGAVTPLGGEEQTLGIPGTALSAHYKDTVMPAWATSAIAKNGQTFPAPTDGTMSGEWGQYNYKLNFSLSTGSVVTVFPHDGVSTFTNGLSLGYTPAYTDVFYIAYCPEAKTVTELIGTESGTALIAANALGKQFTEELYFDMSKPSLQAPSIQISNESTKLVITDAEANRNKTTAYDIYVDGVLQTTKTKQTVVNFLGDRIINSPSRLQYLFSELGIFDIGKISGIIGASNMTQMFGLYCHALAKTAVEYRAGTGIDGDLLASGTLSYNGVGNLPFKIGDVQLTQIGFVYISAARNADSGNPKLIVEFENNEKFEIDYNGGIVVRVGNKPVFLCSGANIHTSGTIYAELFNDLPFALFTSPNMTNSYYQYENNITTPALIETKGWLSEYLSLTQGAVVDLSTYNLSSGEHNIFVIAKADNYTSSGISNTLTYNENGTGAGDDLAGTWIFDMHPTLLADDTSFTVNFIVQTAAASKSYTSLSFVSNSIRYNDTTVVYSEGKWNGVQNQQIQITSKLSEVTNSSALLTWLQANATKVKRAPVSTTKRYLTNSGDMLAIMNSENYWMETPFTSNGTDFVGMDGDRYHVKVDGVGSYGVGYYTVEGDLFPVFSQDFGWVNGEKYRILECTQEVADTLINTYGFNLREITDGDITFTVSGTSFTCKDGMLWSEFIESSYNTGNAFSVSSNQVLYNGYIVQSNSITEKPTNLIDKNGTYQLSSGGSTN